MKILQLSQLSDSELPDYSGVSVLTSKTSL